MLVFLVEHYRDNQIYNERTIQLEKQLWRPYFSFLSIKKWIFVFIYGSNRMRLPTINFFPACKKTYKKCTGKANKKRERFPFMSIYKFISCKFLHKHTLHTTNVNCINAYSQFFMQFAHNLHIICVVLLHLFML